jgi:hypothetical protein
VLRGYGADLGLHSGAAVAPAMAEVATAMPNMLVSGSLVVIEKVMHAFLGTENVALQKVRR